MQAGTPTQTDPLEEDFDDFEDDMEGQDLGSPTDHDEHVMNEDDCAPDPVDPFDIEYDR